MAFMNMEEVLRRKWNLSSTANIRACFACAFNVLATSNSLLGGP